MRKAMSNHCRAMVEDGKQMRILFGFVALAILSFASCQDPSEVSEKRGEKPVRVGEMTKIASETGLIVPIESRLIHFFEPERIVDPVWIAKIMIPASSYGEFEESLLEKTPDNTTYMGALANSAMWWKPDNVVVKKQYLFDRQTLVIVVVSREGGEFAVYVECAVF